MQIYFKFILAPFFIFMLSGCVLDENSNKSYYSNLPLGLEPTSDPTPEPKPEPVPTPEPTPESNCAVGSAMHQGKIKNIYNGRGLSGVIVTINGCSTKTDSSGFYTLDNIAEDDKAAITMQADKAYLQSTLISIKEYAGDDTLSTNYTEYDISKYSTRWSYYAEKGMDNSIGIISRNTEYIDTKGVKYDGIIYAGWVFKNTMKAIGRDSFPGAYEGKNSNGDIVPFVSYGFFSLELKNIENELLKVSESITLKLGKITGTTAATITLWYYNYNEGIWIEKGSAKRESDGSYIAQVPHAGTWSLNEAIKEDPGIYRGRIVDINGDPLSDVRLQAVGVNWISKDLSTDEEGSFEINVIPNSDFRLKAYNYRDKYKADYSEKIMGITSGIIFE